MRPNFEFRLSRSEVGGAAVLHVLRSLEMQVKDDHLYRTVPVLPGL